MCAMSCLISGHSPHGHDSHHQNACIKSHNVCHILPHIWTVHMDMIGCCTAFASKASVWLLTNYSIFLLQHMLQHMVYTRVYVLRTSTHTYATMGCPLHLSRVRPDVQGRPQCHKW